jgi:hypothetical protein
MVYYTHSLKQFEEDMLLETIEKTLDIQWLDPKIVSSGIRITHTVSRFIDGIRIRFHADVADFIRSYASSICHDVEEDNFALEAQLDEPRWAWERNQTTTSATHNHNDFMLVPDDGKFFEQMYFYDSNVMQYVDLYRKSIEE